MKINKGDFIDSRQFSREECERFIKSAVESGYTDAEGMKYYRNTYMELDALGVASSSKGRHVPYKHIGWGHIGESLYGFCNNISQQFREFLAKENSMSKFKIGDKVKFGSHPYVGFGHEATGVVTGKANSRGHWQVDVVYGDSRIEHSLGFYEDELEPLDFSKKDLKDGMRVTMRSGHEWYVCGKEKMVALEAGHFYEKTFSWSRMTDTLEHDTDNQYDIVKVVDRDNTVVWERQEAPTKKKVTLELTDEQIAKVKAQFML